MLLNIKGENKMKNVTRLKKGDKVRVNNLDHYPNARERGTIDWIMEETIVVNFGGYTVNILKKDVALICENNFSVDEILTAYQNGMKQGKKELAIELSKVAEKCFYFDADDEARQEFTLKIIAVIRQTLKESL